MISARFSRRLRGTISAFLSDRNAFEIYDSSSRHLVWRGEAHDQLSDKPENTHKLEKTVDQMLDKFPPR